MVEMMILGAVGAALTVGRAVELVVQWWRR